MARSIHNSGTITASGTISFAGLDGEYVVDSAGPPYSPPEVTYYHEASHFVASFQLGPVKVEATVTDTLYDFAMTSPGVYEWVLNSGPEVPGYPAALPTPSGNVSSWALVRAVWGTVTAAGESDTSLLDAGYCAHASAIPMTPPWAWHSESWPSSTAMIPWSISLGWLELHYERTEVNLGETYQYAVWTDQLQVTTSWYRDPWPVSGSCGSASLVTNSALDSQEFPVWAAIIGYGAGLRRCAARDDGVTGTWDTSRIGDTPTTISWALSSLYPGLRAAGTEADTTYATYSYANSSMSGTVEGSVCGPDAPDLGSWGHTESGHCWSKGSVRVVVDDVLTRLTGGEGLLATTLYAETRDAEPPVAWTPLEFAVTGGASWSCAHTSRYTDRVPTAAFAVTLTDESLAALNLPTGDNKVPTVFWGLNAVSNPDTDLGPVYRGAYSIYRQAPLNVLRPNDATTAPSLWEFVPGVVTWEQDEDDATFVATFLAGGDMVATKALRHHYWTVWSAKTALIQTGTAPPDGTPQANLWQWMFSFDDTYTKRKAGRAGLRWASTTVPCLGGVVNWASGAPVAVELPAEQAEDIHSWRSYGFVRIRYRWTRPGFGPAPSTTLTLTVANSSVTITDNHNTDVEDRLEGYEVARSDHSSAWTVGISDTGSGDGAVTLDLLAPNAPPLEIVDSLELRVAGNADTGNCVFELLAIELPPHNPTTGEAEGRGAMWRAYARRRRFGDDPMLPREYTGWWWWCDGLSSSAVPDGELVHWASASPDGIEFCNSVVSETAVKVVDRLFPFSVMSRLVGPWGQEGFYGETQLDEGDAAMASFYDADHAYFGPGYASDFLEGLDWFECEDNVCADTAGGWQPPYAIRAGQISMAEGMCAANGGQPIVTFWRKILKSPRACVGHRNVGGRLLRAGAGREFGLWETDGTDSAEVCSETADDWAFTFFPQGVQEQRNDEGGDPNPDADRPEFRGDVLAPGVDSADLLFPALHAQELPYWALATLAPAVGPRISTTRQWGDGLMLMAWDHTGDDGAEVLARWSGDCGATWQSSAVLVAGSCPAVTRACDGTFLLTWVRDGWVRARGHNGAEWGDEVQLLEGYDTQDHEVDRWSGRRVLVAREASTGDLYSFLLMEAAPGDWRLATFGRTLVATASDDGCVPSVRHSASDDLTCAFLRYGSPRLAVYRNGTWSEVS